MNIISGPRCTGKTTELFQHVTQYLNENPKNKAIIISPTKNMSHITMDLYRDVHDGTLSDRIKFMSVHKYMKYYKGFDTSYTKLFIDEMGVCLQYVFSHQIDTATLEIKETDIYDGSKN